MTNKANAVLEFLMRGGYAARGVVFLIVGALALYAAFSGAPPEGSTGALQELSARPFGMAMLAVVAAGLFAYMLWRFVDAFLDLENDGASPTGLVARTANFISGVTQAVLGATAVTIIVRGARAVDNENAAESWSARLMAEPFGRWLVVAIGLIIVGAAFYEARNAWRAGFRKNLNQCAATERLAPFMRFGLAAKAVVLLIIGSLFAYAGWTIRPEEAVGVGEALLVLERQPFGRALLGLIGAGMIGFAIYCWVYAKYRIAPNLRNLPLETLAAA